MAESESKVKRLRKRLAQLQNEVDQDWRAHWLELSEYLAPDRGRYLQSNDTDKDNRGDKRMSKVINGEPLGALRTLASGMQGGLTSPSRPWFQLTLTDEELMEYQPVKEWLHDCRVIMLNALQRSNFYGAIHSSYEELGTFGTDVILIEEDFETAVNFMPLTIGQYYLSSSDERRIDTLYRRYSLTAREIVEKFGIENVSNMVKKAYEENSGEDRFTIIHVIQPNLKHDPSVIGFKGMEFESIHFEEKGSDNDDKILRHSGYRSIPFAAPRWFASSTDLYGRSPGMTALGDVKMLQKMESEKLQGLAKMTNPPMVAPTVMKTHGKPNLLPGGISFVDAVGTQNTLTAAQQIRVDFQNIAFEIDRVERRIRRFFFNDMFLAALGADKTMTAREVAERHEEKLMMLGPVLERLQTELLDVVIERVFNILLDFGFLPPPPPEMEGMEIKIEYISLLAQAQKMVGTASIEQLVMFTGSLAAVSPEVVDKIDTDEMVDQMGESLGVPPKVVRSDDTVMQIRQARAQAQQQAQQQAAMAQAAKTAKDMSETRTGTDSVLDLAAGALS